MLALLDEWMTHRSCRTVKTFTFCFIIRGYTILKVDLILTNNLTGAVFGELY